MNSEILLSTTTFFLNVFLGPIFAAWLVWYFGIKKLIRLKQLTFREEQLKEFYSPMLGLYKQIRLESEARQNIKNASKQVWSDKDDDQREKDHGYIDKEINYFNEHFRIVLFPKYQKLLSIFEQKYAFAEEETKEYYPKLVSFVMVWEMVLQDVLDRDVPGVMGHSEKEILPLINELETRIAFIKNQYLS